MEKGINPGERIAFAQQQLNLLQRPGAAASYSFETLEKLRVLIRNTSPGIKERWREDRFVFMLGDMDICSLYCKDDWVQILVSQWNKEKCVYSYAINEHVNWQDMQKRIQQYQQAIAGDESILSTLK